MKRTMLALAFLLTALSGFAENRTYGDNVKTIQAVVNLNWLSPCVMRLHFSDHLYVSFDELSHDYHRYVYRLHHCEPDWSESEELLESDWLEGFNNVVIDDFERSINTTVPYTHYRFTLPNDQCRPTMSGNYRIDIIDDDTQEIVASVEFMVTEQSMILSLNASSNTDRDTNVSHQQVTFGLRYGDHLVTNPDEQIQTVVMQNSREDNCVWNAEPSSVNHLGMEWRHRKELIFDAGNEYRKFEVLDPSHPTMGIDRIRWDGEYYQVFPFLSEPRPNYIYDEDADGSFIIRNSNDRENDTTCDYVWVNYRLKAPELKEGQIVIDGRWTTEEPETYVMSYDPEQRLYTAKILQKQGYYSYQYLWVTADGETRPLPSEGNFFQTENRYQAFVYYKGTGERTWRLTSYDQITLR
ncbi:MAG: DUF5103 domain-containing protein [Prevotella sp.]|nr:DUF5103 domain-containing protein [Prevotella sp.]